MEIDELTFGVPRNHILCGHSFCRVDRLEKEIEDALHEFIKHIYGTSSAHVRLALNNKDTILNFIDHSIYNKQCSIDNKKALSMPLKFNEQNHKLEVDMNAIKPKNDFVPLNLIHHKSS